MTQFLWAVLWNTLLASLLTLAVSGLASVSWFRRRPGVLHVLWIMVLAKFVMPAVIPVPLLPTHWGSKTEFTEESVAPELTDRALDVRRRREPAESVFPASVPRSRGTVGVGGWVSFLVACSCSVSGILILRSAIHGIRFHRWLKSVSQSDPRLSRLLERGRESIGCSTLPEVRSLDALCAPFLWAGGRRSCIYIPQTVRDVFDDEQLTGVLFHELAHHVRRDAWFSLFASVVAAVCWWNPLVWWARRQLRWTQELCCDAVVIGQGEQSRRVYAETLLMTFDLVTHGVRLPSALVSSWHDGASLKRRFQMIGEKSVMTRLSSGFRVFALLLAIALLCLPVRASVDTESTSQATDAQANNAAQNSDPAPHLKQPLVEQTGKTSAVPAETEPAASSTRIIGRIVNPIGKPLAGMQIVAAVLAPPPKRAPKPGRRMEWKLQGEVPPSATSDDEGHFIIEKVDARATIMLQFYGSEFQLPRTWQPEGSLATTISLKTADKNSDLEVGYVPRNMTTKFRRVDGRAIREVTITWAPTKIRALWGYAPMIEGWKESRSLAEAHDPRWKDGLMATDETVWIVPPGQYSYAEHNQHVDFGPAMQLGTSWGQSLRAGSEQEITLFFGSADPRTTGRVNLSQ